MLGDDNDFDRSELRDWGREFLDENPDVQPDMSLNDLNLDQWDIDYLLDRLAVPDETNEMTFTTLSMALGSMMNNDQNVSDDHRDRIHLAIDAHSLMGSPDMLSVIRLVQRQMREMHGVGQPLDVVRLKEPPIDPLLLVDSDEPEASSSAAHIEAIVASAVEAAAPAAAVVDDTVRYNYRSASFTKPAPVPPPEAAQPPGPPKHSLTGVGRNLPPYHARDYQGQLRKGQHKNENVLYISVPDKSRGDQWRWYPVDYFKPTERARKDNIGQYRRGAGATQTYWQSFHDEENPIVDTVKGARRERPRYLWKFVGLHMPGALGSYPPGDVGQ